MSISSGKTLNLIQTVKVFLLGVKLVEAGLFGDKDVDDDCRSNSDGQAENIDGGDQFLLIKISQDDLQVVGEHGVMLLSGCMY